MKQFIIRIILITSLISIIAGLSSAQEKPYSIKDLPDNFAELSDLRTQLLKEIPEIRNEFWALKDKQDDMIFSKEDLTYYSNELDLARRDLELIKKDEPVDEKRVNSIEDFIRRTEVSIKRTEKRLSELGEEGTIATEIEKKEKEMAEKEHTLNRVENKINNLLNRELATQKFKWDVSIIFAVMVGLLIIGFFIVAGIDENVRQNIFSSQAGIQFLTLFSLVIAIILFGITGVLGGKELAALLGGISGYILGRVT